ncbi:phosphoribosyl-AMP cyclohydrolase [Sessilibacter sp. MAH2]
MDTAPGNNSSSPLSWLDDVKWTSDGLVPAIAQDAKTGRILMMAWMNREALAKTAETKTAVYYSRSRQKLWPKGESSGHVQNVRDIQLDCDSDVIVLQVEQIGGIACHTGRESCFYRSLINDQWQTQEAVIKDPSEIYKS